jgi:hypothetical protein
LKLILKVTTNVGFSTSNEKPVGDMAFKYFKCNDKT